MKLLPTVVGAIAVALFLLCFQLKKREQILVCNIISRSLYILQYFLLGEFIGAAMDLSAIPSSAIATKKDHPYVKKFQIPIIVAVNLIVVAIGAVLYTSPVSILPILAVIFETGALWFSKERVVRMVSLAAQPMWFSYNLLCGAYASAVGNALASVSIIIALIRYRHITLQNEEKENRI